MFNLKTSSPAPNPRLPPVKSLPCQSPARSNGEHPRRAVSGGGTDPLCHIPYHATTLYTIFLPWLESQINPRLAEAGFCASPSPHLRTVCAILLGKVSFRLPRLLSSWLQNQGQVLSKQERMVLGVPSQPSPPWVPA